MSRLFKRQVELTVARPQSFWIAAPNAVTIRDLRVQFQVEKTVTKEPNTCDITVTNLAPGTRGEFEKKPLIVRLDAGFDGELERVFAGDLIHGESKRVRTDWETKLQVADGARAYAHARVNRSFVAGTKLRIALEQVARSLGLRLPALEGTEFDRQFAHGVSLYGPAQREMTRLLKPYDLEWSIQDGRLRILRIKGAKRPTTGTTAEATIISQDAGMIGSPEFGTPEKKGKPPTLTVKCLLKPRLTPGDYIAVESRSIRGTFRMSKVTHSGDTHGGEFTTTILASQVI